MACPHGNHFGGRSHRGHDRTARNHARTGSFSATAAPQPLFMQSSQRSSPLVFVSSYYPSSPLSSSPCSSLSVRPARAVVRFGRKMRRKGRERGGAGGAGRGGGGGRGKGGGGRGRGDGPRRRRWRRRTRARRRTRLVATLGLVRPRERWSGKFRLRHPHGSRLRDAACDIVQPLPPETPSQLWILSCRARGCPASSFSDIIRCRARVGLASFA